MFEIVTRMKEVKMWVDGTRIDSHVAREKFNKYIHVIEEAIALRKSQEEGVDAVHREREKDAEDKNFAASM